MNKSEVEALVQDVYGPPIPEYMTRCPFGALNPETMVEYVCVLSYAHEGDCEYEEVEEAPC